MKLLLIRILASWFAGASGKAVEVIRLKIAEAEKEFPSQEDNSHRMARFNWVRLQIQSLTKNWQGWAINAVVEMLVAYARKSGGAA